MKIRAGFVSNSSSTSFLIISKDDLNRSDFFELMGVSPDSPIADLFAGLYQAVMDSINKRVDFTSVGRDMSLDDLFAARGRLTDRMIEKIKDAEKKGLKAYYGHLDSDTSPIESFFCTDSFEIENQKIYFNGLECTW